MKRTLLLIAVVALFAFLLTWNFAPRVDASKDKRRPNASPASKSDGKTSASDTSAQNSSKAPKPVLFSQDKAEPPPLIDLGLSRSASFTGKSTEVDHDFDDPDLPSKSFLRNGIDKEEYHRLRDEYIASLRGLDLERPFAASAKRSEAINRMNDQQKQMRVAAKTAGANVTFSLTDWAELGPTTLLNGQYQGGAEGTVNGRATAVVVDPTDSNTIYLGTAQGGVWRSLNGGATWTSIFDTAQSLAIGSIALAPSSPTTLYVGTGEPNNSGDSFFGVGVYRIDNAKTTPVLNGPINPSITTGTAPALTYNCFNGRSISKILVDPTNAANIFVSTATGIAGAGGNALSNTIPPLALRGVFRSTNATAAPASVTFSKLIVNTDGSLDGAPATGNTSIFDMVLDPGFDGGANQILLVTTSGSATGGVIMRSTNALAATPTFTQTLFPGFNGLVMKLAINKVGAVVTAYVATNEPSVGAGCGAESGRVRKSVDGGVTWSVPLPAAEGYCGGQCSYDNPIAVDPTDANIVYIGGNARGVCSDVLQRSNDGGTTFTRDDTNLHADAHSIFIDPNVTPHKVWFANDGGIYSRNDAVAGTTWTSNNNSPLGIFQFVSVAVHPTDQNFTIGGTQDNGTEAQQTTSGNWTSAEGGDGGFALIDQSATDTGANLKAMYHTFFNQTNNLIGFDRAELGSCLLTKNSWAFRGVYPGQVGDPTPSCDGTTFDAPNGLVLADTVLFYAPMALGPGGAGNPNTLYFGTNKLYRSTNRGDTMTIVSQNLIAGVAVSAIGISPTDDNVRIVGMRNGNVFATTTGSSTLTNTAFPFPTNATGSATNRHIGRAVIDPANSNTAYVTLAYYTNPSTAGQIWRTTNLNAATPTWTSIGNSATGLPNIPVNAFAVDANDPSAPGVSVLYAGTDIGVYHSRDGGATWNPFGLGLPRVAVFDMAIQPTFRRLRVATHGRGMWEILLPGANGPPVNTVPGAQNTNEDVPLVFTGATQISIADPDAGSAAVKVTLTAANGTISLSGTTGLTFTVGDGTSDATMTFTGTITDINNALNNLTFTPTLNFFSPPDASLTILTDDQGNTGVGGAQTDTDTVNITVNSANDAPSFTKGPDQTVNENSGPQTVNNWATNISAGPGNESGQTLTFQVTNNTNPGLFSAAPAISSTGTLTYTPAASNSGTAVITVALKDNGGTANGGVDTSAPQTFNITVNEGGTLQFSLATYSVAENSTPATITITRTGGTAGTATVVFSTSNGTATAGQDYTSVINQTVTFNDGDTSKTVNVPITDDLLDENDETVNLTLSSVGGSGQLGAQTTAVLTINDDDATPSLSINDVSLAEGDSGTTNFKFTITLSAASGLPVTVNYATVDGTATAGSDYVAIPSTLLTFNPGDTSKDVNVTVNGDIFNEPNETFFVDLSSATNATIADNQGLGTINNDDAIGGMFVFSASNYIVAENAAAGGVLITVKRNGTTTQAVTVDYATSDMTATERKDYTTALGTLRFDVGEDTKTFFVLVNVDAYTEASEFVGLTLSNPTGGAVLGAPANATIQINDSLWTGPPANPIDDAQFFVRQQYHDFLNREPDAPGLAFWTSEITGCGSNAACIEVKRIHVSAAFFLSIEFHQTGGLVRDFYVAALDRPLTNNMPSFVEFERDTQAVQRGVIVDPNNNAWQTVLNNNRDAFMKDFVTRAEFVGLYPTTDTPTQYVDKLYTHAGVSPGSAQERTDAIAEFGAATTAADTGARGRALLRITQNLAFQQREFNRSFVQMEYFGYLRRNPNDSPDADFTGYNFWVNKMIQFNGDFIKAEMVKAFINSIEYRQRFGN